MKEKKDINDEIEMTSEDEVINDDIDIEEEDASFEDKIKALRTKLSVCEKEKQDYLEELQRGRADFLNSKRRLEEQLVRDRARSTDKILNDLLVLVDSFDTAMADRVLWQTIDETWRTGIEAIHTKLLATLKNNDVIATNPLGERFNPQEHEAVSNAHVADESQVDTVIAVLQKGFKRNEMLLRPARVVVGTK